MGYTNLLYFINIYTHVPSQMHREPCIPYFIYDRNLSLQCLVLETTRFVVRRAKNIQRTYFNLVSGLRINLTYGRWNTIMWQSWQLVRALSVPQTAGVLF